MPADASPFMTPDEPQSDVVRVLVADEFPIDREASAAALQCRRGFEVVGLAADTDETLEMARALRPDVAVMDLRMPNMSGFAPLAELTTELPATRVLLLTGAEERETLVNAISAGAAGFLTKPVKDEELADAVMRVSRGEPVLSPSLSGEMIRGLARHRSWRDAPAN